MIKFPVVLSFVLGFLMLSALPLSAQQRIILNENETVNNFGTQVVLLTDTNHRLNAITAFKSNAYKAIETAVPNLGISKAAYWIKIRVRNNTKDPQLILQIPLPTLDFVDFYQFDQQDKLVDVEYIGDRRPYYNRRFDNPFSTFRFNVNPNQETTLLLRIQGSEQLQVPLTLCQSKIIMNSNADSFLIFGIFVGVFVAMFVYNLFLFISTKDNTYLYYIINIFFIGLLQANFQGFPFKYLWPHNVLLSTYAVYILTPLAALTGLQFMKKFLHTSEYLPKLHKYLNIFYIPYAFAFIQLLLGNLNQSYQLLQVAAITIALTMLVTAYLISKKGYRSAKFFIVAWSVFLLGLCIFVLKDYNILPYNTITFNMMPFGSALEVTLLSFALADRINTLKKEKEASQADALRILTENEKLVREQNIVLEKNVKERTEELVNANDSLSHALDNLKEAQSQLVESEKMAGLGQLTAGIAHEINNPINFVTSNIKPLQLDINDLNEVIAQYEALDFDGNLQEQLAEIAKFKKQIDLDFVKTEIQALLSGIDEGARRTAEIIRSLKNFSRLDESDTKPINLNEGLDSTLVLVKSTFPSNLTVIKNYSELDNVECLPGKINQVFMNLITNAVQAIKSKTVPSETELLEIKTWQEGKFAKVSIRDSGTGMDDQVKQKIFEPFFTTKDVGEGTGLGLSIVFRIIESHHGTIEVISKVDFGTEFIITLPLNTL
ncbi:sensor histidine kinase [Pedobacter duraquae]|uniref:histidine kinase n=1 Tax=Pedobacter duraquae TaxID=425511 RepID=A0A4R6IQ29_9SPHI|nr:7TM diverse intracellular signaling domain-containing protein [Pedobacter duraquae]TDO24419.1 hypothetical protein CLV32_0708 [Pedobacter duraquae]